MNDLIYSYIIKKGNKIIFDQTDGAVYIIYFDLNRDKSYV